MGGSDLELQTSCNPNITLVLVGSTGKGKSATGNTILGRKAFALRAGSSGLTATSEMQSTLLPDGCTLNVIDTPGLLDYSASSEVTGMEIMKCMDFAKNGIHAFLLVLSVRSRFSTGDEASLNNLQALFGEKFLKYMIIVFTGGDELKDNNETLEEYLGSECPDQLQKILLQCGNRIVLFDNKTKAEEDRIRQLNKLLSLVDLVVAENGVQLHAAEYSDIRKNGALYLHDRDSEDRLKAMTKMAELMKKEYLDGPEKQLAEEHAARLVAEKTAMEQLAAECKALSIALRDVQADQMTLKYKIQKLTDQRNHGCFIL